MPELSVSIREGIVSREKAIERMNNEQFSEIPSESMNTLCNYVRKTQRSLIHNAQRIAKRKEYL